MYIHTYIYIYTYLQICISTILKDTYILLSLGKCICQTMATCAVNDKLLSPQLGARTNA